MTGQALRVRGLGAHAAGTVLLAGVDVDLAPGRVLAVLGPSGSGKSTFGLGLLGESGRGVTLTGTVETAGRPGYVPQHPGTVLDPVRRVGPVLDELAAVVHPRDRAARGDAVTAALAAAQIPEADLRRRFPHQLSGGQQQRVALALTLVTGPGVVVLDEPTTALDAETTAALTDDLARLAASGVALILLTHDRAVARRLAHEVIVLRDGRVERRGPTATVLDADVDTPVPATPASGSPRLRAHDLTVVAGGRPILDGASLDAAAGDAVAVVGRSGAGKTTLARALAGLVTPRSGWVEVDGRRLRPDVLDRDADGRRAVQYVHQDPRATFADHRPVLDQVARPGVLLQGLSPDEARAEAVELLADLGVDVDTADRGPGALSGGQLQRAAVVRALSARPAVLVADEITAALDAEHRARLIAVLERMRAEHGTTVVVVSHDLEVVRTLCASTLVMADGRIVAGGPTEEVLSRRETERSGARP